MGCQIDSATAKSFAMRSSEISAPGVMQIHILTYGSIGTPQMKKVLPIIYVGKDVMYG